MQAAGIDRSVDTFAAIDDFRDASSAHRAGSTLYGVITHAGEDPVNEAIGVGDIAADVVVTVRTDKNITPRHNTAGTDQVADDRLRLNRITRVDDTCDQIVPVSIACVVVFKNGYEAVAKQARDTASMLVTIRLGVDGDDVAFGRHVQGNAGDRIKDRGDMLRLHIHLTVHSDGPGDRDVVAVFAAEAGCLEV